MKISFIILFTAYVITYLSEPKSRLKTILISVFLPIIYFLVVFGILTLNYGGYSAGQIISGSIIPIILSGLLLYLNLNNKIKGKNRPPYFLICLVILFFILSVLETSIGG